MANKSPESKMDISHITREKTCQLTTFRTDRRTKTVRIPRGESVTIGEVEGCGRVVSLWLTFPGWFWMHWDPDAHISPTILKTLIVRIFWDGRSRPAVCVPAGDFFGVGLCETANFSGHYFGMSSGGFYCRFPMPFRKGFRIEMENRDPHIDTEVFLNCVYQLTDQQPEEAGYFHSTFRTGRDMQDRFEIADVAGRGHYAGCTLSLQGRRMNDLSFLEAPEHVYLDDNDQAPAICGTGLEDYFLGGWYFREGTFAGPLHGVPVKDPLRSCVAMYRVHTDDAIRFQKSFRFTFQHPWKRENINPFFFSSCAFFYLDTPEGQPGPEYSSEDLLSLYRVRDTDHQSLP